MKYIVIRIRTNKDLTRELPIIFPDALVHSEVAEALLREVEGLRGGKVVSAGMLSSISVRGDKACYGESESLGGIKSRGDIDGRLMSSLDYTHGIV